MVNNASGNETFGKELDHKIWITKGARFNAHQRLMSRHDWSIAAIAFLSTYVLIITLVAYVPVTPINSQQRDIVSFAAMTLSLFILVLSLLEASKSYQMKALQFHNCARELSRLYNRLRHVLTSGQAYEAVGDISDKLSGIAKEYDSILDQCQENHQKIDLDTFKIQHNEDFHIRFFGMMSIHVRSWYHMFLPYLILIVLPPLVVTLLFTLL